MSMTFSGFNNVAIGHNRPTMPYTDVFTRDSYAKRALVIV